MWHWVRSRHRLNFSELGTSIAQDIDGGFEFNGRFSNELVYEQMIKKIMANEDTEYRTGSLGKLGFTVIKEYGYFNWIPPQVRNLVVRRRDVRS